MRLVAFGDSFVFGSELDDCNRLNPLSPSLNTWPAIVADKLGIEYVCLAHPGCSNYDIMRRLCVYNELLKADDIVVVCWTWMHRFSYYDEDKKNGKNWMILHDLDDRCWQNISHYQYLDADSRDLYFKFLHSDSWCKSQALQQINLALELLKKNKTVMTCIEDLIWDKEFHCPEHIRFLQNKARPNITDFQGENFLDWSKSNGFDIGPNGHPLEAAHAAAAELLFPRFLQS